MTTRKGIRDDVVRALEELGEASPQEIAEHLGLGKQKRDLVYYHLQKLLQEGRVKKVGKRYALVGMNIHVVNGVFFLRVPKRSQS